MKILWTELAITKLQEIFDFYKSVATIKIAQNIKTKKLYNNYLHLKI